MVASKESHAAMIVLYQNGLTCKEIATKNTAPERTIYQIIKNLKERGLTAVKKSSGLPRVSSKCQDRLLLRSQLRNSVTSTAELAQEWQQPDTAVNYPSLPAAETWLFDGPLTHTCNRYIVTDGI
ncbi:hypothetical protein cypCar_00025099 [Cyprinus carpio]|nr:hypothetical protein cypCar_00025099 [Cyprinus carpio]